MPGRELGLVSHIEQRDLPAQQISVVGGLGLRSTAGGDYDSSTVDVAAEVRYWFRRHAIWSARARGAPVGWYAAVRLDLDRTSLTMGDDSLGSMRTIGVALRAGYRFAPWRGLEVRPYFGIAARNDAGGGLPGWGRGGVDYGVAVGWSW